jgi:sulfur-oxidizing protein SoxY
MAKSRRQFLQTSASLSAFLVFSIGGLLKPGLANALWREKNFKEGTLDQALKQLFQDREIISSKQLIIKAPRTAENGATVPVTIKSKLDKVSKIYLLVEKNPIPLAAEFTLSPEIDTYLKARVKMAESCDLIVIADNDGQLLATRKGVNVTVGGCGG